MTNSLKTDVAIIGAGPAGLLLAHLLRMDGIECRLVERQSQSHVLARIRAGILERTTTDILDRIGINARLNRAGMPHQGFFLSRQGEQLRINIKELTGRQVMVYGQTELTADLVDAAPGRGIAIDWQCSDVSLHDIDTPTPKVTYRKEGRKCVLEAQFIAGCDGFHGPSRKSVPTGVSRDYETLYPFGWLGILADVPPCHDELIYATHERGFALASMRSATRSRYYIQVGPEERLEDWPDDRLWSELKRRLGPEVAPHVTTGAALEKSIVPLRSYVFEPMHHGRLFLAGDAAHIVPPTGAKGLNLAASDVTYLADALTGFFRYGVEDKLAAYSARALSRVWKSQRFSAYLTRLMHNFPGQSDFERKMREAEFDYVASSEAMRTTIAENYAGLPIYI